MIDIAFFLKDTDSGRNRVEMRLWRRIIIKHFAHKQRAFIPQKAHYKCFAVEDHGVGGEGGELGGGGEAVLNDVAGRVFGESEAQRIDF